MEEENFARYSAVLPKERFDLDTSPPAITRGIKSIHIILIVINDIVVGGSNLKFLYRDGGVVHTVLGLECTADTAVLTADEAAFKIGGIGLRIALEVAQGQGTAGAIVTGIFQIVKEISCIALILSGIRAVDLSIFPVNALLLNLQQDKGILFRSSRCPGSA